MLNINSIEVMEKSIELEKNKYQMELSAYVNSLHVKKKLIQKMHFYIKDYENQFDQPRSTFVPGLYNNLFSFIDQIKKSVAMAEFEALTIQKNIEQLYLKITGLEQKSEFLVLEKNKMIKEFLKKKNKKETCQIDDLVSDRLHRR